MKKNILLSTDNNTFATFQNNAIKKQQTSKIKGGNGVTEDGIDI